MTCPACHSAMPEGARFCPSCGHALQVRADERRIATVMFADVVGYTTLSESMDPEQVKAIIDKCFARLVEDIASFGGLVDKIIGDAIVALFGAPLAHEDDPERAVRAALHMQQTMAAFAAETGTPIEMRVGVNTGEVLVGALRAAGDYTATGDVVNVASRLQSAAAPGQVLVGAATYAATRDAVCYEPLGVVQAKGREEPVEAWVALAPTALPGRRPRRVRTPLVGRDVELGMLRYTLTAAARHKRAQMVLLLGEAGVGKSRLAEETAAVANIEHAAVVLEGQCLPYGEANVWWPMAEAIRQACGVGALDHAEVAREKCRVAVARSPGIDDVEADRLAAGLLYLLGFEAPLEEVEPSRARDEALRAVQALFECILRDRPLVLVLSELHWADTMVLELVDRLLDRLRNMPLVLVATARPDLEERWSPKAGRHNLMVVNVEPLERADAAALLSRLLETEPPADVRDLLLDRSGGNPLFLEELVALLADSSAAVHPTGGGPLSHVLSVADLPATLRGLVAARIDALASTHRAMLEDAAVIGHSGPIEALETLSAARGDDADQALGGLVARDHLTIDDRTWAFRSDLVRNVAYETLTKAERARRHAGVAAWLARRGEEHVDQLAYHYGAAAELVRQLGPVDGVPEDVVDRAVEVIAAAAQRADARETYVVSASLFERGLHLIGDQPSATRRQLLLGRARAKAALRDLGSARADADQALLSARTDADIGDEACALTIIGGIEHKEGRYDDALKTLDEAITLCRRTGDGEALAEALRARGMTSLFQGDAAAAERSISEAREAAAAAGDRRGEAWALQHLAWIGFSRGELEQSEEWVNASVAMFTEIGDWGGLAWAIGLLGWMRFNGGHLDDAQYLGELIVDEARDSGDRWGYGMTLMLLANVALWQGRTSEAIARGREAQAVFDAIGDAWGGLRVLAPLSRALALAGRVAEARAALVGREAMAADDPVLFSVEGVLTAGIDVHVGDGASALAALPNRADFEVDWSHNGELAVLAGMAQLQIGDVEEALAWLEPATEEARTDGHRAYAGATLAFALAAAGRPQDAADGAGRVIDAGIGSYLDRAAAGLALGFAQLQLGQHRDSARTFASVIEAIDATGDVLDQAVWRLAWGHALAATSDARAGGVLEDARQRLRAMGANPSGWDTAFALAARDEA